MNAKQGKNKWDVLIVGGGLAGGLLLHALRHFHPQARVLLLERQSILGGNHTWCFHSSDVQEKCWAWLKALVSKSWTSYEVVFPRYHREIPGGYHAIRSEDFHHRLMSWHGSFIHLNQSVTDLDFHSVTLSEGEVLHASCVIDARGWPLDSSSGQCGFQKFLGLDVRLKKPHGLQKVRLKDAKVSQTDGYRFIYLLPWNEYEILVEDTYYSNQPSLDRGRIKKEIGDYIQKQGWEIEAILREEVGCLPLSLDAKTRKLPAKSLLLGAASGIYQPVTGYTFPQTLERVQALAETTQIAVSSWQRVLNSWEDQHRSQVHYLSFLNRMMFRAAEPTKRYLILERFYTLSQDIIERFYQGKLSTTDKIRILCGKPPVSILKALRSFF